jgi:ribosome-associated protein
VTPKTLAKKIAQLALTKKSGDVVIMDLRKLTDMTDFFVVCSGDSDTQVRAIADAIADGAEKLKSPPWHQEGLAQGQWVLLDFVDVVVHIFHKEARKFYSLEKLWGDAVIETVSDEPPAKMAAKTPAKAPAKRRTTRTRKTA